MTKKRPKIYWCLYPLALLYGLIIHIRNKMFDWNILKSRSFHLPVICIGNISVGGTGKTPHTEYLINLLKEDFHVAVLSRGYKRKSKGFVMAKPSSTPHDIGDEPYQMAHKFVNIAVAVDADRCNGIEQLTNRMKPDVILLDDAYQHRYVKPGFTILLIDYNRPIYTDCMLPAGRLREAASGKDRADIIIITKCPEQISAQQMSEIKDNIKPLNHQLLFFTYFQYCSLKHFMDSTRELPLTSLNRDSHILLLTGIASPLPLINELKKYTEHIEPVSFADHHDFTEADMEQIETQFNNLPQRGRMIITTEKDAARLANCPVLSTNLKQQIFILPIEVKFIKDEGELFNSKIIEYVKQNSRNSSLHQG